MEPIALAIDFLQTEGIFYGFLLPTLVTIKLKLRKIVLNDGGVIKKNILEQVLASVERRFHDFFTLNEMSYHAIIASVSHPDIKLKWYNVISETSQLKKFDIHEIIISEMNKVGVARNIQAQNVVKTSLSFLEYEKGKTKRTFGMYKNNLCACIYNCIFFRWNRNSYYTIRK